MPGKLYAVGVGPGDPELMTLKAIRIIKNADCIACPGRRGELVKEISPATASGTEKELLPGIAYEIAKEAVPEIVSKELLLLEFPMRKDNVEDAHHKAAEQVMSYLSEGKNIAFLTLGDPEFYSTFFYIAGILKKQGYEIVIVSGITSFSAAAARVGIPLSLGDDPVMITSGEFCDFEGTLVILKVGRGLREIKKKVAACNKRACLVENCGRPDEKVYCDVDSIPDETGYFSVMIVY